MNEVEFVNGLIAKAPHQNAPEFVKAKLSIKRVDLVDWLMSSQDEWINIDIKESKSGKWYAEVDNWKPEPQGQQPQAVEPNDDMPF